MTAPVVFQNTAPEFVAVVLASSVGARLFPMTDAQHPKHMLPVAGEPVVFRLLKCLTASGFTQCVLGIAQDDSTTLEALKTTQEGLLFSEQLESTPNVVMQSDKLKLTVVRVGEDCQGSAEALRQIEVASVIPASSHIVVFPGDLVVFDTSAIRNLVDTHRQGLFKTNTMTACTMLLADVGEEDEHGAPLKESSKQKKGGLARDEEEIEYMALSYASTETTTPPRVVWKQSKLDVEADEDMVGSTPKLVLPKPRLRQGVTRVRTEWSDLHVYALAPWVRRLIVSRTNLLSVQDDLVPLLISRQFQGVVDTFGSKADKDILDEVLRTDPSLGSCMTGASELMDESARDATGRGVTAKEIPEYAVLAHIQESALRANTIASYLYASKDVVTRAVQDTDTKDPSLMLPEGTSIRAKFHSILLPETDVTGKKITYKSVCVGRRCQLGDKCRLNNVIIMDDCSVGDNVILQNTIIGAGCKIGDNCNLNDCQVSPGKTIPAGTKEKGESFID